ncbi:MAG TPA: magnesium transporter [Thermoanaerobaculia bacterium]|jgi:magnesium transporter
MQLVPLLGPDLLDIVRNHPEAIGEGLRPFHPADVAEVVGEIPREDQVRVLENLTSEQFGEVLPYLGGETVMLALTRITPRSLAVALDYAEPDDAARILSILPEEKRAPVLEAMTNRAAAAGLLTYEPGTAGRLMTARFVRIRSDWTVGQTLDRLRTIDPTTATVSNLYVVENERLTGVVSLRKLLPLAPTTKIGDVMTEEVITVGPDAMQEEVARLVSKYSFNALPVVDSEDRPLGIITVDDVLDVLVARETESILRMGGVGGEEDEEQGFSYFGPSIVSVVRRRVGWLMLLFVAATLTGNVLRHFSEQLSQVVALSFFIPLIIGTGGNAGSQTVSTIIRALALGQVHKRDVFRVLLRESAAGLLLGTLLCVFAAIRALMWGTGTPLALVVGLTILVVCAWANVVAALVPILAQKFKIDPTLVSAPMITTVVDASGLAIYMLIAQAVL